MNYVAGIVEQEDWNGFDVDLVTMPGVAIKELAHTVCLAWLGDFSPMGQLIFNQAIQVAVKVFVPKGMTFVAAKGNMPGGFDFENRKVRRGQIPDVLSWIGEQGGDQKQCEFVLKSILQKRNNDVLLIANNFGLMGYVQLRAKR